MQHSRQPQSTSSSIGVGDTVRLDEPYTPAPLSLDGPVGTFTHGIVVEIVTHQEGPESDPRSVSLHLYNPRTRSVYMDIDRHGSLPIHVDKPVESLVLVHDSADTYRNLDPEEEGEEYIERLPADESTFWDRLQPHLDELKERDLIDSVYFTPGDGAHRVPTVMFRAEESEYVSIVLATARRIGWEVKDRTENDYNIAYTLTIPENAARSEEDATNQ